MASNAKALSFLSGDLSLSGSEVSINVAGSVQSDSITGSTITMKNTGSTIVASDGTTAVLSESGGTVTIDADVSTIGSATISGGSITGTEIDLKSSGTTIFASDGTTSVLSESGGTVTLTADEANVGSNALVVDSSGNVGIGTSSPGSTFPLTVYGLNAGLAFQSSTSTSGLSQYSNHLYLDITRAGTAGDLIVRNGVGLTERMRIDSSGNVGIGTTSPGVKLSVSKGTTLSDTGNVSGFYVSTDNPSVAPAAGLFGADNNIGGASLNGYKSRGTNASPTAANADDSLFTITGYAWDTTTSSEYKLAAGISFKRASGTGGVRVPGYIVFYTSSDASTYAERMRINSSGAVTISNLGSGDVVATNGVLSISSDIRLKNYIGDIDESGIETIKQLTPRYYSWKEDENNRKQLGFFAQEVFPILPEAVPRDLKYEQNGVDENGEPILEQVLDENGEPDYQWGFATQPIVAMLVKAIQEQQTLIESQQSQLDALTVKTQEQDFTIASLISRIEALENP